MTYADLAWNAPFYAKHGFEEVAEGERLPDPIVKLQAHEGQLGLAVHGRRVLMRRTLRRHRTRAELDAFLPTLDAAPKDIGVVRLVVRRPTEGEREVLDVGELNPDVGLVGDNWIEQGSSRTPDGSPHPDIIQITDQPHTGCGRFISRFGKDTLAFVNGPEGRPRRLRGLNARVLRAGTVRPGDQVRVVRFHHD